MLRTPLGEIGNLSNARRDARGKPQKSSNGKAKTRSAGKDRSDRPRQMSQPMALQLPYSDYELRMGYDSMHYVPDSMAMSYDMGSSMGNMGNMGNSMGGNMGNSMGNSMGGSMGGSMGNNMSFCYQQPSYPQATGPYLMDSLSMVEQQVRPAPAWVWEPEMPERMERERSGPMRIPGDTRNRAVREEKRDDKDFMYPGHPQYSPIDVQVKNTFISLAEPRTPSPTRPQVARTPVIASTCPPKFQMTEQERLECEVAREAADEAAALFAGKEREVKAPLSFDPTVSVGSLLHRAGLCKPCAWFHHAKGCQRGVRCEFCHCCPPGEIKKRKKEKTVQIRKRRQPGQFCDKFCDPCW